MDTVSYVSEAEWNAFVAKAEARSKITKAQNRAAVHAALDARLGKIVDAWLGLPVNSPAKSN